MNTQKRIERASPLPHTNNNNNRENTQKRIESLLHMADRGLGPLPNTQKRIESLSRVWRNRFNISEEYSKENRKFYHNAFFYWLHFFRILKRE